MSPVLNLAATRPPNGTRSRAGRSQRCRCQRDVSGPGQAPIDDAARSRGTRNMRWRAAARPPARAGAVRRDSGLPPKTTTDPTAPMTEENARGAAPGAAPRDSAASRRTPRVGRRLPSRVPPGPHTRLPTSADRQRCPANRPTPEHRRGALSDTRVPPFGTPAGPRRGQTLRASALTAWPTAPYRTKSGLPAGRHSKGGHPQDKRVPP